jgi:hypothetical protein
LIILYNVGKEILLWDIDENSLRVEKPKNSEFVSATSCNINLTLISLKFNPVQWGQIPDSKSLSHCTAEEEV